MLFLFDKNENLIHDLPAREIDFITQHEELNKLMTLEFAVYIEANYKMKDIHYVAHVDMENYQRVQMYRLINSESDDYTVNYQAVHVIFDELKSYGYIRDKRPDRVKASTALDIALAGSRWKVGRVDDSELLSTNFYDCTRIDALSKIIKTWNMDLDFYLTFNGNKITGRYVDLLGFRGEDTGERFVYGTNALEVVKEVDVSDVYTRVIPRGKGEEKVDEEGKPTDGYGRRIKIDDVVWEKAKGDPIDKPKGQEFLELKEMTRKFGFSDGEARTRVQIFEDIEDPKELIKAGYNFLVQVSRPLVQFKTKISKKSRTNVGDIVRIIRWDLNFKYRTRIYKAHRNLLNRTLEVEFGDKLVTSPADRDKIVNDNLNALENRLKETETDLKSSFIDKVTDGITQATFNRDGYNYELKKGNKYGLPAGYYSFDREIDNNPQRVIYVGAGTLAIADSKKSNGDWNFRTFGTGKGFVADLLVAGTILGGNVRWNLEDGTFLIGKNANDYSMYWDGSTLHFRNVDIDLKNNRTIQDLQNKQGASEKEIADRKAEIANANKAIENAKNEIKTAKEKLEKNKEELDNLNADLDSNKEKQEEKYKVIDEEILNLGNRITVTDGKIESTVESTRKSLVEIIDKNKSELSGEINDKNKDLKTYITNNYSTKTQTDEKISSEVGSLSSRINSDINSLNREVTEAKSMVEQTQRGVSAIVGRVESGLDEKIKNLNARVNIQADKIESKVSKNGFSSLVKQEFDRYKIEARNIDFDGSYINARGTFQTMNDSNDVGVKIDYNKMVFQDNRWNGKTFGGLTTTNIVGREACIAIDLMHYATGYSAISYYKNDDKLYHSYMDFDKWNYTGQVNSTWYGEHHAFPIVFKEGVQFRKQVRFINDYVNANGCTVWVTRDQLHFWMDGYPKSFIIDFELEKTFWAKE